MLQRLFLWCAILGLAACSDGSGKLADDAAVTTSERVALDLRSGELTAVSADAATLDSAAWRAERMLFRRIEAGTAIASGGTLVDVGLGEGSDDAERSSSHGRVWVAVFEVTQTQWRLLSGDDTAPSGTLPATGIAPDEVPAALARIPLRIWRLSPISDAAWTAAVGSREALFAWGNSEDDLLTSSYAVCQRSDGSVAGLRPVGSCLPTGAGFQDLHGNAWEIVVEPGAAPDALAVVRGGAWDSPPLQCRTANRLEIPRDLRHPNVGLRLMLTP